MKVHRDIVKDFHNKKGLATLTVEPPSSPFSTIPSLKHALHLPEDLPTYPLIPCQQHDSLPNPSTPHATPRTLSTRTHHAAIAALRSASTNYQTQIPNPLKLPQATPSYPNSNSQPPTRVSCCPSSTRKRHKNDTKPHKHHKTPTPRVPHLQSEQEQSRAKLGRAGLGRAGSAYLLAVDIVSDL